VRMVLHGQLAVRAFDLLLGGRAAHAQYFVVIAFCLRRQKITSIVVYWMNALLEELQEVKNRVNPATCAPIPLSAAVVALQVSIHLCVFLVVLVVLCLKTRIVTRTLLGIAENSIRRFHLCQLFRRVFYLGRPQLSYAFAVNFLNFLL